MTSLDYIWIKEVKCPICEHNFKVYNVKSNCVRISKRDTDFMVYYDGVNPSWYFVWVCPRCYYASFKEDFLELSEKERRSLQAKSDARMALAKMADFSGERDLALALLSYEICALCYLHRKASDEKIANTYLRAAWIAREDGNWDVERKHLTSAVSFYKKAFETSYDMKMGRADIMYLIGEIERRLDNFDEAMKFFSKVFEDRRAKAKIVSLARDQYHLAKKQKKEMGEERVEEKVEEKEEGENDLLELIREDAGKLEDFDFK
jgi:hypothetical protein